MLVVALLEALMSNPVMKYLPLSVFNILIKFELPGMIVTMLLAYLVSPSAVPAAADGGVPFNVLNPIANVLFYSGLFHVVLLLKGCGGKRQEKGEGRCR